MQPAHASVGATHCEQCSFSLQLLRQLKVLMSSTRRAETYIRTSTLNNRLNTTAGQAGTARCTASLAQMGDPEMTPDWLSAVGGEVVGRGGKTSLGGRLNYKVCWEVGRGY